MVDKLESSYNRLVEKKSPPDWCDDCSSNPGEKCPDCGYTHNC